MKIFFAILLFLAPIYIKAQTANAGPDKTIYLSATDTAILDGSFSSATSYLWSEVSSDYSSGGTIHSTTSNSTYVSGITKQGVFYFQIAATTSGVTKVDTMKVTVNLSAPPTGAILLEGLNIPNVAAYANNRSDTSNYIGYTFPNNYVDAFGYTDWMERSRLPGMAVDAQNGKYYSTIEDGYGWNNNPYARSEMTYGAGFPLDSNKIYLFEWKGYYLQDSFWLDQSGANWAAAVTMMQIHGNDANPPPLGLNIGYHGNLFVGNNHNGTSDSLTIGQYRDFVRNAHTVRILYKEGKVNGYVKVWIDGRLKYSRVGWTGSTFQQDYPKSLTNYDYGNRIVDYANHTRNRKFSLISESYQIWKLTDSTNAGGDTAAISGGSGGTSSIAAPTIYAGNNDSTTLSYDTLTATYSTASGHTATILWRQTSGATCTIGFPTAFSTPISGLTTGTYEFTVTITQDDGQVASDYVFVYVNIPTGSAIKSYRIINIGTKQKYTNK